MEDYFHLMSKLISYLELNKGNKAIISALIKEFDFNYYEGFSYEKLVKIVAWLETDLSDFKEFPLPLYNLDKRLSNLETLITTLSQKITSLENELNSLDDTVNRLWHKED